MRMGRKTIFTWPTAMPSEEITSRDVSTVDALGLLMVILPYHIINVTSPRERQKQKITKTSLGSYGKQEQRVKRPRLSKTNV